jgi:DNA-binding transcriptional LysR family regulator
MSRVSRRQLGARAKPTRGCPVDRRQLEYFVVTAETGSMTRAAARLGVAQPSLSHSICSLEREVATPLFERLGRGVRLTSAGEALVGPARVVLRGFALAAGAVAGAAGSDSGRIAVVAGTPWALEPLVGVLGELRQLRPGLQVTVADCGSRSDLVTAVCSGDADFGLLDGTPPTGLLDSRLLAEYELVAVLPPQAGGSTRVIDLAGLARLGLVCTPPGTPLRTLLHEQLEVAGAGTDVAVETAHLASIVPLVLAGAGAALLPVGPAAEAAAKGARVAPLGSPVRASVHLLWRADRLPEAGEHLLSMTRELQRDLIPS